MAPWNLILGGLSFSVAALAIPGEDPQPATTVTVNEAEVFLTKQPVRYLVDDIQATATEAAQAKPEGQPKTDLKDAKNTIETVQGQLLLNNLNGQLAELNRLELGLQMSFEPAIPGLTVTALDPTLRAQLNLEEKVGALITAVEPKTLAEKVGLKPYDVIVKFLDKPVEGVESLSVKKLPENLVILDAAVEAKVDTPTEATVTFKPQLTENKLTLVREGKPLTLMLHVNRKADENAKEQPAYFIGVPVGPIDPALRSQLKLDDGVGLVITDTVKDSPAEKAGIKPHDVLVRVEETPIKEAKGLVELVQESKGKPIKLVLIRAGQRKTVEVTPTKRETEPKKAAEYKVLLDKAHAASADAHKDAAHKTLTDVLKYHNQPNNPLLQYHYQVAPNAARWMAATPSAPGDLAGEVKALTAQVKKLEAAIDRLTKAQTAAKKDE